MTKQEIAQNEKYLLLPQCFPLLVIGYSLNYRDFLFLTKYVQSRLLQNCRMRERVKGTYFIMWAMLIYTTSEIFACFCFCLFSCCFPFRQTSTLYVFVSGSVDIFLAFPKSEKYNTDSVDIFLAFQKSEKYVSNYICFLKVPLTYNLILQSYSNQV